MGRKLSITSAFRWRFLLIFVSMLGFIPQLSHALSPSLYFSLLVSSRFRSSLSEACLPTYLSSSPRGLPSPLPACLTAPVTDPIYPPLDTEKIAKKGVNPCWGNIIGKAEAVHARKDDHLDKGRQSQRQRPRTHEEQEAQEAEADAVVVVGRGPRTGGG